MASRPRRTLAILAGLAVATAQPYAFAQPAATPPMPPPPPPPQAPAAPPAPPANEKVELAAGDAAAHSKDWSTALAHYQAAAHVAPGARAEMGAADALYQLGRLGEAYDAYTQVLTTYGSRLTAADRALVTGRLKDLTGKTGWLSVRVAEPGANVEVDGHSIGVSPVPALLRVPVGPHVVRVTKDGFTPVETRGDISADGKQVVDITLVRAATQGHLIVQSTGESVRVLIDGVDVGVTPWEGDVAPGPHDVTGRTSTAIAPLQKINVVAGTSSSVALAASSISAHLQIRTSDGQGLVVVDGSPKGQGAFAGDVAPGQHTVTVSRDGYQPYQKALTLAPQETWAETVTLSPAVAPVSTVNSAERPIEGIYGGLGLAGLFGVGGQGTELETGCDTLGASSCNTPSPMGGGLFGYVGFTWNPVGFELLLAGAFDTVTQTATYTGVGGSNASPYASPARVETFHFYRAGGLAAARARAIFPLGSILRATVAGGLGLSYKEMFMTRRAVATSGGAEDFYVPGTVGYLSPAVTVEVGLQVRVIPTLALAIGGLLWADSASIAGSNSVPAQAPRNLLAANQAPQPIPTPEYHLATGPQVFLGPYLGLQFGP
ncbi:MAG TPA: PEGA domain-containing protein [Polyangiaceae bacterium]|nr:PEGA domain-containing protein [Polyangiaceae bacterium]